jgi:hypothetical protein
MSDLPPISTTLFISSSQVDTKSALGSTVTIDLKTPLDTYKKRCRVLSSAFWYSFPNISDELGNRVIEFTYDFVLYTLTLEEGIYSITDIEETLEEFFEINSLPKQLFQIIPDEATNKITLKVKTALAFIFDFETNNTLFKTYLGFVGFTAGAVDYLYESTNRANLNLNNSLYINVSFASGNYYNQNAGSNIVATVPLNKPPNTLIYTENSTPVTSECTGGLISKFTIWITNESGVLLNMAGEDWNIVLDIF